MRPIVGVVVGVMFVAGFCGMAHLIGRVTEKDDWVGRGEPVPALSLPATPQPTWEPPNEILNPQPLLKIRHDLETSVLAAAGVAKPTKSSCDTTDFTGERAADFTCTVTYGGLKVGYEISAQPGSNGTFKWEANAEQTVVTRQGLLALLYRQFGDGKNGWQDLRCEEFTELVLVPVDQPLDRVCYAKKEGDSRTSRLVVIPSDMNEPFVNIEKQ